MIKEMGNWVIDTELKQRDGHKYYVCKHRCNLSKVELVFVRADGLSGKKELCNYLKELGVIKCTKK